MTVDKTNPARLATGPRTGISRALESIEAETGNTPLARLDLRLRGDWRSVHLKLEWWNPTGSIKDRTAVGLVQQLNTVGELTPRTRLIESTSGNLGVALASIARRLGIEFVAVVDPKASPRNVARMRAAGALIERVHDRDLMGGYLLARLDRVRALLERGGHELVWTDQYHNPAGPGMHYRTTAPEIYRQMHGAVDAVLVAVSTGGSLAGIARYFREVSPATRIVAVDAVGSAAIGGDQAPRDLVGIGASLPSSLVEPGLIDHRLWVCDADAFATCRLVRSRSGLAVGGSSGAVIHAAAKYQLDHPEATRVVGVLADDGGSYAESIYDDRWLTEKGHLIGERQLPMTDVKVGRP
jgi:2,3-diaminopropionate biosynthesis protein SbnA